MTVKKILSISVFTALIYACGHSDAQYYKDIVGSWQQHDILETGVILEKTFTFSPDGKFLVAAKRIEGPKTTSYQNEGTWTIEQGTLHFTILHSTHPNIPSGYESTNKIVKITEKEAISENSQGKVTISYRVPNNAARSALSSTDG